MPVVRPCWNAYVSGTWSNIPCVSRVMSIFTNYLRMDGRSHSDNSAHLVCTIITVWASVWCALLSLCERPSGVHYYHCVSVRPSVSPGVHYYHCVSVRPSVSPGVHYYHCVSVRPSVSPGVHYYHCVSVRPSVSPGVHYYHCVSVRPSVWPPGRAIYSEDLAIGYISAPTEWPWLLSDLRRRLCCC